MSYKENEHPRDKQGKFVDKHVSSKPNLTLPSEVASDWGYLNDERKRKLEEIGIVDIGYVYDAIDYKQEIDDIEIEYESERNSPAYWIGSGAYATTETATGTIEVIAHTNIVVTYKDGSQQSFADLIKDGYFNELVEAEIDQRLEDDCFYDDIEEDENGGYFYSEISFEDIETASIVDNAAFEECFAQQDPDCASPDLSKRIELAHRGYRNDLACLVHDSNLEVLEGVLQHKKPIHSNILVNHNNPMVRSLVAQYSSDIKDIKQLREDPDPNVREIAHKRNTFYLTR